MSNPRSIGLVVCTLTLAAGAGFAQSPYGEVEFRWRERGLGLLPSVDGVQTTTLAPGAGLSGTSTSGATNTTDARFMLVLEARVTRHAGNADLSGFFGGRMGLWASDTRAQSWFAADTNGGAWTDPRNAASATTAVATTPGPTGPGVVLPAGVTMLPGTNNAGDRGLFGPFRYIADLGQKNTQAIGRTLGPSPITNFPNNPSLETISPAAAINPLLQIDEETGEQGPFYRRFEYYGLNNWVPVFAANFEIFDTATARAIDIQLHLSDAHGQDTGLRGFRIDSGDYVLAADNGSQAWPIDVAPLPTFRILVPAPGSAALVALAMCAAARRRRTSHA
jgi:hypothetical protein